MVTLNIEGKRVKIDDGFMQLPPEQQNAVVHDIAAKMGIKQPDAMADNTAEQQPGAYNDGLGQTDSMNELSQLSQRANVSPEYQAQGGIAGTRSFAQGMADMASFGLSDEIAAGLGTVGGMLPGGHGKGYSDLLDEIRGQQKADANEHPIAHGSGMVTGALAGGGALARGGLSLGVNAARSGAGFGRTAALMGADGALVGGAQGFGSGEGIADRFSKAGTGAAVGGTVGAVAPYAISGIGKALSPLVAPIMSRLRPGTYSRQAMTEALARSGSTPDEIAAALQGAQRDGQGMYTVADAMGNSGQRMLSTVARNPHAGRQAVVETLQNRQMGQGERLSNALSEGFNAPDTALARQAGLTAERSALADVNFAAARNGAGPVDVSGAISSIDDTLSPGVNGLVSQASNIADDSIEGVLRRVRGMLTDGDSQLTDFPAVMRAKQDIADMIAGAQRQGKNNQVRLLSQVNRQLDAALERASPGYRMANDAFRQQSQTIDAVDAGGLAASGRTRAADNIDNFNQMTPAQQQAFRAGYVDPYIAKVENAAASPTTNKARGLMTEKTKQEFPAFAAPRRGEQMGRRIDREQRMFETANEALGGSKTADNLADAAELARFDPGVMAKLFSGRPIEAVMTAVTKSINSARGMSPSVMEDIATTLLETRPDVAQRILQEGVNASTRNSSRKALANVILLNMGASANDRTAYLAGTKALPSIVADGSNKPKDRNATVSSAMNVLESELGIKGVRAKSLARRLVKDDPRLVFKAIGKSAPKAARDQFKGKALRLAKAED